MVVPCTRGGLSTAGISCTSLVKKRQVATFSACAMRIARSTRWRACTGFMQVCTYVR
jgi:hypothetical protein